MVARISNVTVACVEVTLYHGHPCPSFWLGPEFQLRLQQRCPFRGQTRVEDWRGCVEGDLHMSFIVTITALYHGHRPLSSWPSTAFSAKFCVRIPMNTDQGVPLRG